MKGLNIMKKFICQSCGMPMESEELLAINKDGSCNKDYCIYCYKDGEFTTPGVTVEQEIEICIPFMKQQGMPEDEARKLLKETLPNLKRWKK